MTFDIGDTVKTDSNRIGFVTKVANHAYIDRPSEVKYSIDRITLDAFQKYYEIKRLRLHRRILIEKGKHEDFTYFSKRP